MPWGVMILLLLGGYLFLNWARVSRYLIRTWPELYEWKTLLADIPYLGAASLALVIGVLLPWPINQFISRDQEIRAITPGVENGGAIF